MDANRPQNKTYRSFFLFLQSLTLTFVLFLAFFDESWSRDEEILCRMGRGMIFQKVAIAPVFYYLNYLLDGDGDKV